MFGQRLRNRRILIVGLMIAGLVLAGCEEEVTEDTTSLGGSQATVNVAGTITEAGYAGGDFVVTVKDSTGLVVGSGIVTGGASVTFSIAVPENSGEVFISAYDGINGASVFGLVR